MTEISAGDLSAFIARDRGGAGRLELLVRGASCAGCMRKIESGVAALPGVTAGRFNLTTGKLTVTLAPGQGDPAAVQQAIEALGYRASLFDPGQALAAEDQEGRRLALALGVAGFGAGNVMMFTVPAWAGLFGQELSPAARIDSRLTATPRWRAAGRAGARARRQSPRSRAARSPASRG